MGTETQSWSSLDFTFFFFFLFFFFPCTISPCVFYPVVQLDVLQEVTPVDFLFSDLLCCCFFFRTHPLQWPLGERPWLSYFPSCSSPNLSLSSKYQCLFKTLISLHPVLKWASINPCWRQRRTVSTCLPTVSRVVIPDLHCSTALSPLAFPTLARPSTPLCRRKSLVSRCTSAALDTSPTRSPSLTFDTWCGPHRMQKNFLSCFRIQSHPPSSWIVPLASYFFLTRLYVKLLREGDRGRLLSASFATHTRFFFLSAKSQNTISTSHQIVPH